MATHISTRMTHFSPRVGALVLAVLSLSACDSGGAEGGSTPSALVGSWSLQSTTTETFATLSEAQTVVDRSRPTTGTIAFSGAETGTFRFLNGQPENGSAILATYDARQPVTRQDVYELRLNSYGSSGDARLVGIKADGTYVEYVLYSSPTAPFTYADGRLTLASIVLQDVYNDTRRVTVSAGTMAFQATSVAAGQKTRVRSSTLPFDMDPYTGFSALRYILEDGGGYRAERDFYPNRTLSVAGTWAADGNRLRLSVTQDGMTETEAFTYALESGQLQLGVSADPCRANASCRFSYEQELGIRPGTLSQVSVATTTVFSPTATLDASRPRARPDGNPARRPADAATRALREAAVWPRLLARPDTEAAANR